MECVNHPGVAAAALCTRCDKSICETCREERNGKSFCADCAAFLDQRQAQRPPRPQTGSVPLVPPGSVGGGAHQSGVYQGGVFRDDAPPPVVPPPVVPPPPPQPYVFAPTPAKSDAEPQAAGDVYQGPGDVYPGPGEVYQGAGAVYSGPSAQEARALDQAEAAPIGQFFLLRALIFGAIAGFLAMLIWYQVALHTGKEYGLIALLVGAMVGFGCRLGAGVADQRAGMLAVAVFLVAVLLGKFMIVKKWYFDVIEEEQAYEQSIAGIEEDCDYTEEEAKALLDYDDEEWLELNSEFRGFLHRTLEEECREDSEGYDEFADEDLSDPAASEELTPSFGQTVGMTLGSFGFIGMILLFFGAAEAFKIASTEVVSE